MPYEVSPLMLPFIAGQITDLFRRQTDTVSCLTVVPFGYAICDTNEYGVVELPSPANTKFSGFAQYEHLDPILAGRNAQGVLVGFAPKYPIPRLKTGRIAVPIDDDVMTVTPADKVYIRTVAAGLMKLPGQARKDASGAVEWVGLKWTGRIIPGKLAEVSLLVA